MDRYFNHLHRNSSSSLVHQEQQFAPHLRTQINFNQYYRFFDTYYTRRVVEPIFMFNCPYAVDNNSSTFLEISGCKLSRYTYLRIGEMDVSEVSDGCRAEFIGLPSWPNIKEAENNSFSDFHQAILYGFELDYHTLSYKQRMSVIQILRNSPLLLEAFARWWFPPLFVSKFLYIPLTSCVETTSSKKIFRKLLLGVVLWLRRQVPRRYSGRSSLVLICEKDIHVSYIECVDTRSMTTLYMLRYISLHGLIDFSIALCLIRSSRYIQDIEIEIYSLGYDLSDQLDTSNEVDKVLVSFADVYAPFESSVAALCIVSFELSLQATRFRSFIALVRKGPC